MLTYKRDLKNVDWEEMKTTLSQDKFDNSRNAQQLRASFAGIAESKYESGDRCNQTGATHRKRY
jgi:hypothetical protein